MTPTPQEHAVRAEQTPAAPAADDERVVISGMSGLYPESTDVKQLADILYNKVNPVTNENNRWKYSHPEVAQHTGKVPHLNRFDAQFFRVHYRLGNNMDSMSRKILEQTYQAIYDAGVSPEHLSGKKVGVYIGTCFSETEKACFYVASSRTGFGIAGCSKAMFANRISYWLNAKGPSLSIDSACCSSTAALEQAYLAMSRGECEAAIVGGANLCLHPQSSIHYGRIMTLCMDGKTKSFDQNADGCAKSEAINVLFLQKAKDALRIYADVMHVKSEFTSILNGETGSPRYGFYRNPKDVANFLNTFYKEAKIPPHAVEYVEAFGSAVPEADKAELEALDEVFCKNRSQPLLVGSVMSNIGYGEAACGISAVTKVLLGYHTGKLAGNLHCETPRQDVDALNQGRMRVVTDHQTFKRSFTAVNGISVTGVNAHVLLHGHYKPKDLNRYQSNIPHLVTLSGRQESAVQKILLDLKSRPIDPEELALLHNIHEARISGHLGRGYTILSKNEENETVVLAEKADYFDDAKRPLWFVYSGMGSQWSGMGTQLMRIPIFAAAIERCRKVLEPKGVDIVNIITSTDKTTFDNILHSFVGIAAVQIGLTDILREMGLVPDNIIGHSVGELGCAYADGCFTAEEMILSAYSRGLVSLETPFIRGSMAAVGIGYQTVKDLCPPEIQVACHNGPESSTISGPADAMREFVAELTAKGIFAKEVPCSNIAYHSKYIAEAGPGLLKYLSQVIKTPKARSERWMSTSVPQEKWNLDSAKFSSAEYHTNNLLSPVLFEETSKLIPSNAVIIEVAPHGLLQAILKRSLPSSCCHIPLTRRGHPDNAVFLLEAIGKIYMQGYNPMVKVLYPKIEFPVSTGTPMLSHLTEWAHNEIWNLPLYVSAHRNVAAACKFIVSIYDKEYNYLQGHVIRGKTTFPFAAALVSAWDTLAMTLGVEKKQISVEFRDVHLYSEPTLYNRQPLRLSVALHRGTGRFEIMNEDLKVATGIIVKYQSGLNNVFSMPTETTETMELDSENIYQLLNSRDYSYGEEFQSIKAANVSMTEAELLWRNNWVTFIEGLIQLNALRSNHDGISQPYNIRRMCINIDEQNSQTQSGDIHKAVYIKTHELIRCGGVVIENMKCNDLPSLKQKNISMKPLSFVPHQHSSHKDVLSATQVFAQVVAENRNKEVLNVVEIVSNYGDSTIFKNIELALSDIPGIKVNYDKMNKEEVLKLRDHFLTETDLVLVQNLSSDDSMCQTLYRVLQRDTFVLNGERDEGGDFRLRPSTLFRVVASGKAQGVCMELVRWRPAPTNSATAAFSVNSLSDLPLLDGMRRTMSSKSKLLVLDRYPSTPGLKDLIKQWRKEIDRNQIYLVMVNHNISENQSLDKLPELDLAYNILDHGMWGGEYYVPLEETVAIERPMTLTSSQIGNIESLQWIEAPEPTLPGINVTVHFAALNNVDVKRATGVIPLPDDMESGSYGMDYSGVTDSGERVMGVVAGGAVSSKVRARPELLWPVPAHWSLEEAATVPLPYAHAFYCLGIKGELIKKRTILIHGGAGALGQAAISIALAIGCKVFATVSDIRKKHFLRKLFPELKDEYIGNSRDETFGDMVLQYTQGKGCDIIICCLTGELKNATLNCGASSALIFDTTQLPNKENYEFGMHYLTRERNYIPLDFSSIFANENVQDMKKLRVMMSEGIARGWVRPLSRVTYAPAHVASAFQLLAASKHRGRVLLRMRDSAHLITPRITCSADKTQVVLCYDNIYGVHLADRLISRGARKLHLHFANIPAFVLRKIRLWQDLGVEVEVSSEDLSDPKNVVSVITESVRMAPVEGIFMAATVVENKFVSLLSSVLQNLDLVARKLCPNIMYFVVLTTHNSFAQKTCMGRAHDRLPATFVHLPVESEVLTGNSTRDINMCWRNALDAMEQALRSTQAMIRVYQKPARKLSLLQQIAVVAGVNLPNDVSLEDTLQNLGIPSDKSLAIYSYLRDYHNICISQLEIPNLTVQRIYQLEALWDTEEFERPQGLKTFFSYVDSDELTATTEIVQIPTLTQSASMRDDEFDVTQTYLCIIPGLEGHYQRFLQLTERLKLPAFVLQPGLDRLNETVEEMAQRYAKILLKKTEIKNNFYLLGYESGVLVALETAAILEEHGLTGTVFCLGFSPAEMKIALEEQLTGVKTEHQLQNMVVKHMYTLMTGENSEELRDALERDLAWNDKKEACVRQLRGRVQHSAQYAQSVIEAALARIEQVRRYNVRAQPLRSRIVLLRAAGTAAVAAEPDVAQSLQPVTAHDLPVPLAYSTADMRCAAIINQYLAPEILEAFDKRNLCETYLINADTFMSKSE